MTDFLSRLTHAPRRFTPVSDAREDIDAFIDSRTLEYPGRLEDAFAERARNLGVESGMVLDVGTRVGLIALKILWQNENFFSIGVDASKEMVDRARETATAWGLNERAFFQVGDARRMRLKSNYFDLAVSDCVLHSFDDPISVLCEIGRVLKPSGALLIRDFRRPNRFRMSRGVDDLSRRHGARMRRQIESSLRAACTLTQLREIVRQSKLERANIVEFDEHYIGVERRGTTDPNSWVSMREQDR